MSILANSNILAKSGFLSVLCLLVTLSPPRCEAQIDLSWTQSVGALTPFDANGALDLAAYCDGTDELDDTTCARQWQADAASASAHMIASAGTYYLSQHVPVFSGMHLRCVDNNTAVFKKVAGTSYPHFAAYSASGFSDVLIENCGFDMNGDPKNFAHSLTVSGGDGGPAPVSNMTIRGNRYFDSTGMQDPSREKQRQYVVITKVQDLLVENNIMTHGGRIKAGRPGRRIWIRHNDLNFINDNGITVVSRPQIQWADGTSITEDILIENNRIHDATVTGIFFGADGETQGVGMTTRRITVRHNLITGDFESVGINGMLPDFASEIRVHGNVIVKDGPKGEFTKGIQIRKTNDSASAGTMIGIANNLITTRANGNYPHGAIFVASTQDACIVDNVVFNTNTAIWVRASASVLLFNNAWNGGTVRNDGQMQELPSLGVCASLEMKGDVVGPVALSIQGS